MANLLMLVLIPLHLELWTPVPFSSPLPQITEDKEGWTVTTKGSAGGYLYLMPGTQTVSGEGVQASWEWKVQRFPSTHPVLPFDKANDDYALRVGILFSQKGRSLAMPSVLEKPLKEKGRVLSHIVLYGTVAEPGPGPDCGVSPVQDQIIYCMIRAESSYTKVTAHPIEDLARIAKISNPEKKEVEIIGIWLFADSDNSKSESSASLKDLRLEAMQPRDVTTK